jgi:hypothetical protein
MTSRDFCYWLQGYFEIYSAGISGGRTSENLTGIELSPKHVAAIQKHLSMVFKHEIDPSYGGPDKQDPLNHLHNNGLPDGTLIRC